MRIRKSIYDTESRVWLWVVDRKWMPIWVKARLGRLSAHLYSWWTNSEADEGRSGR